MGQHFFFILKKTRKDSPGWDFFTGKYLERDEESEYYVAWSQKSGFDGFIVASRDTLPDLKEYLNRHYEGYRFILIDNKELGLDG